MGDQVAAAMARLGLFIDGIVVKAKAEMAAARKSVRPIERKGLWLYC